ncbi:hypothetical protein Tco_0295621 [Tanacetum coccineum]
MANKEAIFITIKNFRVTNKEHTTRCFGSWIDRWEYGRRVKKYEGFRVDVKRKSIEDKVRREVFEVDEALAIENSRASSFQVRGNHVDETKVNAVWDWASPKILPEVRHIKVAGAFQEEDELECTEPLDGEAEQVTYVHYNGLVTCDVVAIEACHVLLRRPWKHDMEATHQSKSNMYLFKWSGKTIAMLYLGVVSPKTKLENKTLATLVASPKDFQAERKETGVSYALVMKGVNDVMENAIPAVIKPLLAEFGKIVTDDTLDALPPLRNIQLQIDLSRKTTLLVSISNEVLGFDSIKELCASDEDFGNIWMELEIKQHRGEFLLLDGYLFKGRDKTIVSVQSRFDWPQLKRDVGVSTYSTQRGVDSVFVVMGTLLSNPKSQIFVTEDCDDGSRPKEQHLVVPCSEGKIVKFPTQLATTEIRGDNGSNLEDFLIVLTREEADIIGPIMAVEDEPLMMLGSGPNIIKEDFSNDLDGQHSIDESKPYHNTLRWHIMRLKWGYVISIGQIYRNVWLKQEMVCAQRRTWDPGITWLKILKEHLEDKKYGPYKILRKINDNAYVVDLPNTMSISKTFNVSDIYEFHSEDVNEGTHSRTSSSKERGNDEDMIQEIAEEYMVSKNK